MGRELRQICTFAIQNSKRNLVIIHEAKRSSVHLSVCLSVCLLCVLSVRVSLSTFWPLEVQVSGLRVVGVVSRLRKVALGAGSGVLISLFLRHWDLTPLPPPPLRFLFSV